jgi:cytochrome P450
MPTQQVDQMQQIERPEAIEWRKPIPGPRRPWEIARLVRALTSDPCPALDRASETYGLTFAVRLGPMTLVVVGDPDHLGQLLMSSNDAFIWGHRLNILRFFVGGTSLIVSDGDAHRRRRSQVQPGFARRHLDQWAPMIVAETDRMIDEEILDRVGPIDLFPIERMLVLRLVLNVLFGAGLNERAEEIGRLIEPGKEYLEQQAFRQVPHPFPRTRRSRARSGRDALAALVFAEIARRRGRPLGEISDLLDTLVAEPDETRLTDEEICDQVITLIGAGYDTIRAGLDDDPRVR